MKEIVNVTNLKQLSRIQRIKQVALAKEIGVAQGVVSDWQNGKYLPSTDNLIKLAKFFHVSTDCILDLAPIPEDYAKTAPLIQTPITDQSKEAAQSIVLPEWLHTRTEEDDQPVQKPIVQIAPIYNEETPSDSPSEKEKLPFNKDQIAYMEEWGNRLKEDIVSALREVSSLSKEQDAQGQKES